MAIKTKSIILFFTGLVLFVLTSHKKQPTPILSVYSNQADIVNFSQNPPTGKTGAPGENTCTFCHIGSSVLSAQGVVTFLSDTSSAIDTGYVPGVTYPMQISVASGSKNGFQLTILTANNQKAGSFINGTNTSTALAAGREYIRQSNSNGLTTFDFEWTAPSTNLGDLRAFYTVNKANANGIESGDKIYMGDALITSNVPVSTGAIDENPNKIRVFWDAAAQQIHIDYQLNQPRNVLVNVQSISGQAIQSTSLGIQSKGKFHQIISGNQIPNGIYIVSVFVNNHVHSQKMILH
ncbi:MAG: choice-of-anchor V domain-containing protein [Crocinitomicaceae bacterium]